MAITLKDIAKKAGVSVMTVSRVLNNKPDIGKETKDYILKIAHELGYTPNSLAKSLVTRKTNTIGIIVPDNLDPYYPEVVQGIADECRDRGYSIILCLSLGDADKVAPHSQPQPHFFPLPSQHIPTPLVVNLNPHFVLRCNLFEDDS